METEDSILALAALAQSTRLEAFRLLVRHEPGGLPAGDISSHLAIPANTLSSHLGVLTRAGLIKSERRSRSIIYRADLDRFRDLVLFLLKDCCRGRADLCEPLLAELAPCCP
jgi:ArsR family transcriptional regulator